MRAKRFVWYGGLVTFMALLIIGVGCAGSRSVTGPAAAINPQGLWTFTADSGDQNPQVLFCDEGLGDLEGADLGEILPSWNVAAVYFQSTGRLVGTGTPVSFDGTVAQTPTAGTRSSIVGVATVGAGLNVELTFSGGIDDNTAFATLSLLNPVGDPDTTCTVKGRYVGNRTSPNLPTD